MIVGQTVGKLVTVRGCRNSGTLLSIPQMLVPTEGVAEQIYLRKNAKSILLALLCAQSTNCQAQQ